MFTESSSTRITGTKLSGQMADSKQNFTLVQGTTAQAHWREICQG